MPDPVSQIVTSANEPTQIGNTSLAAAVQDARGNTSSKRVAGMFALLNATALIWVCLFTGRVADPVNVVAIWAFTFGCFALTLPEWLGKKP